MRNEKWGMRNENDEMRNEVATKTKLMSPMATSAPFSFR